MRRIMLMLLMAAALAAAPLRSPAALPGAIQAMYDAGKFRQVLRETAIVVNLRDPAKFGYDLHAIWLLKAESHLRLKQPILSAAAFESASKVAPDKAAGDFDHAMGLAVGQSKAGVYIAEDHRADFSAKGFNLVNPADRPEALRALFQDRLAAAQKKLAPLAEEKSVKKILEAADLLNELRRLERAVASAAATTAPAFLSTTDPAEGPTDKTDAIARKLAVHIDVLLSDPLVKDADAVETVARNSAQMQNVQVNVPDPAHPGKTVAQQQTRKQGLGPADVVLLSQVEKHCADTIAECDASADRLAVDPSLFQTTTSTASALAARAAAVANAP